MGLCLLSVSVLLQDAVPDEGLLAARVLARLPSSMVLLMPSINNHE